MRLSESVNRIVASMNGESSKNAVRMVTSIVRAAFLAIIVQISAEELRAQTSIPSIGPSTPMNYFDWKSKYGTGHSEGMDRSRYEEYLGTFKPSGSRSISKAQQTSPSTPMNYFDWKSKYGTGHSEGMDRSRYEEYLGTFKPSGSRSISPSWNRQNLPPTRKGLRFTR